MGGLSYFTPLNDFNLSLILCLETSAKACSVALSHNGTCISKVISEGEWKHSKLLTTQIEQCLAQSPYKLAELAAVAVTQGPGSYTGLRVGTSCAKGLCYGLDIKLISVPTLEIIAQEFRAETYDSIIPMIDARRMEVYYNIYDNTLQTTQETDNLILDEDSLAHLRPEQVLFCGDGAFKVSKYDPASQWVIRPSKALAEHMAPLAQQRYEAGRFEDLAYYVPFYLKAPNITKSTKPLF